MRRPTPDRSRPRAQRGTVVRGVMVLALLAGAVALQSTSPAWQSRLDAFAASLGIASATCQKAGHGPSAPSNGTPGAGGTSGTGWHAGKPSMVAGASAATTASGGVAPAGIVAPAI